MVIHTFQYCTTLPDGSFQWQWKQSFLPLHDNTLMNLWDLPVFDTTGEVTKCTKFLISRVHNDTLWLDKGYPIHVEDIHQLTGLSMTGQNVSDDFQGSGKHGRKKGTLSLYELYGTHRGGHGALIEPINDPQVHLCLLPHHWQGNEKLYTEQVYT
jgi:hypothetical protein